MRQLSFEELDLVIGGSDAGADLFLRELHKKYDDKNSDDVLSKATDEELDRFIELLYI